MKVLLVDTVEHRLFMQGLQSILQANGIDVAIKAVNSERSRYKCGQFKPDAVIFHLTENPRRMLHALQTIHSELPGVAMLALTDSRKGLEAAQHAGADGYLLSKIRSDDLVNILIKVDAMKYV